MINSSVFVSTYFALFLHYKSIIVVCAIPNETLINISTFIIHNMLILKTIILKCFNFIIIN